MEFKSSKGIGVLIHRHHPLPGAVKLKVARTLPHCMEKVNVAQPPLGRTMNFEYRNAIVPSVSDKYKALGGMDGDPTACVEACWETLGNSRDGLNHRQGVDVLGLSGDQIRCSIHIKSKYRYGASQFVDDVSGVDLLVELNVTRAMGALARDPTRQTSRVL